MSKREAGERRRRIGRRYERGQKRDKTGRGVFSADHVKALHLTRRGEKALVRGRAQPHGHLAPACGAGDERRGARAGAG